MTTHLVKSIFSYRQIASFYCIDSLFVHQIVVPIVYTSSLCLPKFSCSHRHHSTNKIISEKEEPVLSDNLRERARLRIAEFEVKQSISPNSPLGIMKRIPNTDLNVQENETISTEPNVFAPFQNNVNPVTGEVSGPTGPEPTRFGDWERKGRCSDF